MGILKTLQGKYKGSSLVETLVAFGLISLIVTVSTSIYTAVNRDCATLARIKALEIAVQELNRFSIQNYFRDETKSLGEFIIQRKTYRSIDFPDCIKIEIQVFSYGKKLCHLEQSHSVK